LLIATALHATLRRQQLGAHADALLKAVFARARLGSALPDDEASALRSLVLDTADQWARLADLLRPTDSVDAAA
jgi:hypothetical protein